MSGELLIRPAQTRLTRRKLLIGLGVGAAAAPLSACDTGSPTALNILEKAEALTRAAQRALLGPTTAMAPEFSPGAISAVATVSFSLITGTAPSSSRVLRVARALR